jgi:hypothetical protein
MGSTRSKVLTGIVLKAQLMFLTFKFPVAGIWFGKQEHHLKLKTLFGDFVEIVYRLD